MLDRQTYKAVETRLGDRAWESIISVLRVPETETLVEGRTLAQASCLRTTGDLEGLCCASQLI